MTLTDRQQKIYSGIGLALITVIIWSGNYVVARGISKQLPPVSLAFYRWLMASVCITPLAIKKFIVQKQIVFTHKMYLFWTALTGITIFNTFIYLGGHYTSAINLALIGTTAAPIFIVLLSIFFLKEKAGKYRVTGMVICFAGILFLLSQGSFQKLVNFHFGKGDGLVLISALAFSVYSILVKKKPATIQPVVFLFSIFVLGTLFLFPFYIYEIRQAVAPVSWTRNMYITIVYLGLGNSIIGFFGWNAAIEKLGAPSTALFANLIPIFSIIEAVIFLGEQFSAVHLVSGVVVVAGVVIANLRPKALQSPA
jgi:drug/metabolite transporter (DMT)-like permease